LQNKINLNNRMINKNVLQMIVHKIKLIINKPMIQIQVLVKYIIKKIKKLSREIRELH
jgi:hypothetical protein